MAEVYGQINGQNGTQDIQLNNAATEATLKLLLQSSMSANKQTLDQLKKLGVDGGIFDTEAWEKANEQVQLQAIHLSKAKASLILFEIGLAKLQPLFNDVSQALGKLSEGAAAGSDLIGAFKSLPLGIGTVANALSSMLRYQEANMLAYQKLSTAGINLGGSLTDVRLSSSRMGLTMDQMASFAIKNSEALARMGGGADEGFKSFVNLSEKMRNDPLGIQLKALGFTTEEVNDGMARYINMSGGRTKAEMQNSRQILEASAEYLMTLQGLSEITGKTRQQQQDALDEASKNAAWMAHLATLDEDEKKKANAGMAQAMALGGKGAVDAFQSKIMGVAPDKAGQIFIATASESAEVIYGIVNQVNDKSKKSLDSTDNMLKGMRAAQRDMAKYGKEGLYAIIRQGGPLADALQQLGITANSAGKFTDAELMTKMKAAEKTLTESTAEAKRQQELQKARDALTKTINEFVEANLPLITDVITGLSGALKWVSTMLEGHGQALSYTLGGLVVLFGTLKAAMVVRSGVGMVQSLFGGGGGAGSVGKSGVAGEILGNVGKAGPGIGGVLTGLTTGLSAMGAAAGPVLAGAAVLAGVIVFLGAGVAVTMLMIGAALPTLANGFKSFNEIDGGNLLKVSLGIGALGLAMAGLGVGLTAGAIGGAFDRVLTFFTGGGTGGITGVVKEITSSLKDFDSSKLTGFSTGLEGLSNAMVSYGKAVNTIDIAKAAKVKELMKGPTAAEQIADAGAKVFTSAAERITSVISGNSTNTEKSGSDLTALNNTMRDILKYIKDTAANTEKTAKEVSNSGYLKRA